MPQVYRYSVVPWQTFRRNLFFSATNSDIYCYGLPCNANSVKISSFNSCSGKCGWCNGLWRRMSNMRPEFEFQSGSPLTVKYLNLTKYSQKIIYGILGGKIKILTDKNRFQLYISPARVDKSEKLSFRKEEVPFRLHLPINLYYAEQTTTYMLLQNYNLLPIDLYSQSLSILHILMKILFLVSSFMFI